MNEKVIYLRPAWVGVEEACEICGLSRRTVQGYLSAGKIHKKFARKIGRHWRFHHAGSLLRGMVMKDEYFDPAWPGKMDKKEAV